jgi:hypothetical protein
MFAMTTAFKAPISTPASMVVVTESTSIPLGNEFSESDKKIS